MNPLLIHTLLKKWVLLLSVPLSLMLLPASQASDFRQPENITGGDITVGAPHMSHDSGGQLLWSQGRLTLVYWEGINDPTTQNMVSHIMKRYWTATEGWAVAERLDHGPIDQNDDIGGRHPTMIRRDDGAIFTAWQDMRHCTAGLNNIEIYGNLQPDGDTTSIEQRLTQTPDTNGNNGYLPRLARLGDGRLVLAWYDFNYTLSEIFLNISDTEGDFTTASDLAPLRITQASSRPAGAENENFVMPAVACDRSGIIHITWTSTNKVTNVPTKKLYYGRYDPTLGQWLQVGTYLTQADGYYDPARLIADSTTGGVWLLYVDRATNGNDELYVEYRAAGAEAFEDRVRLTDDGARQHYPSGLVDANGVLKVVYVDEADDSIRLVTYDRAKQTLTTPVALTTDSTGNLFNPTLELDEAGNLYVVWENKIGVSDINLWFTTNRPPENAARDWILYR